MGPQTRKFFLDIVVSVEAESAEDAWIIANKDSINLNLVNVELVESARLLFDPWMDEES